MRVVFSYMSEDMATVEAMYKNLRANNIDVWMDKQSIEAGSRWGGTFLDALSKADVAVAFFSKHFQINNARVFNDEQADIDRELTRKTRPQELFFVPVRLDNTPIAALTYGGTALSELHCLDLFGTGLRERYERFFATFKIASPKIPHPPESELIMRAATRPNSWDNGVGGFEVCFSTGQRFYLDFGTTKTVLVAPGSIGVQAFIDGNNHLPENEFWVEWFSKSEIRRIQLTPFARKVLEISCTKWVTTNSLSEVLKWPLRLVGGLPKYDDRATWPIGLHITEVV